MPHFKCATCRTRLSTVGEADPVCDGCGSPLEPVTELTELVGYRAVTSNVAPATLEDSDGGLVAAIAAAFRRPEPPR